MKILTSCEIPVFGKPDLVAVDNKNETSKIINSSIEDKYKEKIGIYQNQLGTFRKLIPIICSSGYTVSCRFISLGVQEKVLVT